MDLKVRVLSYDVQPLKLDPPGYILHIQLIMSIGHLQASGDNDATERMLDLEQYIKLLALLCGTAQFSEAYFFAYEKFKDAVKDRSYPRNGMTAEQELEDAVIGLLYHRGRTHEARRLRKWARSAVPTPSDHYPSAEKETTFPHSSEGDLAGLTKSESPSEFCAFSQASNNKSSPKPVKDDQPKDSSVRSQATEIQTGSKFGSVTSYGTGAPTLGTFPAQGPQASSSENSVSLKPEQFEKYLRDAKIRPSLHLQPHRATRLGAFLSQNTAVTHVAFQTFNDLGVDVHKSGRLASWHYHRAAWVWLSIYVVASILIILERTYVYYNKVEIRLLVGSGMIVTRCAAELVIFNLMVCLMGALRATWHYVAELAPSSLRPWIPISYLFFFHKVGGIGFLLAGTVHVVGHLINFKEASMTEPNKLNSVYHIMVRANQRQDLYYWIFELPVGVSGVLVTLLTLLVITTTFPALRRFSWTLFKSFHGIGSLFLILLLIVHGYSAIFQLQPHLLWFTGWVLALYILEQLYYRTLGTRQVEVDLERTQISTDASVIHLKLKLSGRYDPYYVLKGVDYYLSNAGDWVYLHCGDIGPFVHPFSLSSPPHAELSLDINMAGPFTTKLGKVVQQHLETQETLRMTLRGPFRSGFAALETAHAEHVVLVGAGIGLTPICSLACHLLAEHWRAEMYHCSDRHRIRLKSLSVYIALPTRRHYDALYVHLIAIASEARKAKQNILVNFVVFITRAKPSSAIAWSVDDLKSLLPELQMSKAEEDTASSWDITEGSFDMIRFKTTLLDILQGCESKQVVPVTSCGPNVLMESLEENCIAINAVARQQLGGDAPSLRLLADIFG